MTRDELIRRMVDREERISYGAMGAVVKHLIVELATNLQNHERIEIRGFGSFEVRRRDGRIGRNPKTGAQVFVGERYSTHFKPGKELRERVNSAYVTEA